MNNERINKLAEQAGAQFISHIFTSNGNGPGVLLDDLDLEKFAELLVRQCIKSTLSLRDTAIDNEWNLDETFHMIVDTIVEDLDMQHIFRVEE
jgi:hypothetical protein